MLNRHKKKPFPGPFIQTVLLEPGNPPLKISERTNKIRKTINRTLAIHAVVPAMTLKPEMFHGLAHERGEIGRLPGRDQIGVNNHLPVLIECAGLFQFISHRLVAGGASPLQKTGADQDLRSVADGGNRFAASKKAPGDLQRLRLFSHQRRRRATGQDQDCIVVRVDLVKGLVHDHFVAVLARDGPAAQGGHCHFDARLLQPIVGDEQLRVLKIIRTYNQGFHISSVKEHRFCSSLKPTLPISLAWSFAMYAMLPSRRLSMKVMPRSTAVRRMRRFNGSSTPFNPICEPPIPIAETFSPVPPSVR